MSEVVLLAPFAGWLTPLEEVPDPVFAERMMGDGVAVDPIEPILRAPADGTVIAIAETAHAATLRLANGAEVLIHLGLETVALKGAGFRPLRKAGAEVKAGEPLIEMDLVSVARQATSLVTPIVVASDGFTLTIERPSRLVKSGDRIGTVSGTGANARESSGQTVERSTKIEATHGLHARPAARVAALLRPFSADVSLMLGDRIADARSPVAMLGLGARHGDELRITGRGPDSREAVDAVAALIANGIGETLGSAPPLVPSRRAGPVCAVPGMAIGTIVHYRMQDIPVQRDGAGVGEERKRLGRALERVGAALGTEKGEAGDIAAAHLALLEDPHLLSHAQREIADGRSAAFAWRDACEAARSAIRATGDSLLIERAADLLDLERRVIAELVGEAGFNEIELPFEAILVASDLLPSQFLALDKARLAGICTAKGGPTSHVAILAAAAGIPMIVAAGARILEIADGATAILDSNHARLEVDPTPDRLQEAREESADLKARHAAEARDALEPCFTADGVRIEVFANLSSLEEARAAVAAGAEGCGLLRTEFLFVNRNTPPDEAEQERVYADIAGALEARPLVVRTLDIGADKQVPYVALADEENPALGLRGIRLGFARPELLSAQLRAIVRAVPFEQCRIMLPMIVDVDEVRQARSILDEAASAAGVNERIQLGVMVETPAAAMLADSIAAEADFLSVGTNDLTQYALAADRGNAAVANKADALHPAVFRLIRQAAEGAGKRGRWIGVCGGLASDPLAVPILIGLGVSELSVAPAAIATIKAIVRRLQMDACRDLALRVCAASSAEEARTIAAEASA